MAALDKHSWRLGGGKMRGHVEGGKSVLEQRMGPGLVASGNAGRGDAH